MRTAGQHNDMNDLAERFSTRLRTAVQLSCAYYTPQRMTDLLAGCESARDVAKLAARMVAKGDISDGLRAMVAHGHPELTLESIMQEEEFKPLFTVDELKAADFRLKDARRLGPPRRGMRPR